MPTCAELERGLQNLSAKIAEEKLALESRLSAIESKVTKIDHMDEKVGKIDQLCEMMSRMERWFRKRSEGENPILVDEEGRAEHPTQNSKTEAVYVTSKNTSVLKVPRLDFPVFTGEDPVGWVRKAQKFFHFHPLPEHENVIYSSVYLEFDAEIWYRNYIEGREGIVWETFVQDLYVVFCDVDSYHIIGSFNRLSQIASMDEYRKDFESLRAGLISIKPNLDEEYFVASFLGGLIPSLRLQVAQLQPKTMQEVVKLARTQEAVLAAERNEYRSKNNGEKGEAKPQVKPVPWIQKIGSTVEGTVTKVSTNTIPVRGKDASPVQSSEMVKARNNRFTSSNKNYQQQYPNAQKLSYAQVQERMKKNLCYHCDEPYVRGHQQVCKKKYFYMLEGVEEEEAYLLEEQEEELQISVHAIAGNGSPNTIRLQGLVKKRPLYILVDSGSTHNFLDPMAALQSGCEVIPTSNMNVTVANGEQVISNRRCSSFKWTVHGEQFEADMRLLPLGGCDVVLGVQWLKSLGPVLFDFNELSISFEKNGRKVVLEGIGVEGMGSLSSISGKALLNHCQRRKVGLMASLWSIEGKNNSEKEKVSEVIQGILRKFDVVFQEPQGLAPSRNHEHHIPLVTGASPVSVRPYRYPYVQKTEIERLVKEMQVSGIIRDITSPFVSPVLLVKKKTEDGDSM